MAPQDPCRGPTWHIRTVIYFWATVLTKCLPALPRPRGASHAQILMCFCDKGPEQSFGDPAGNRHTGHFIHTDQSRCPNSSISLALALAKSSMSFKLCREPYTPLDNLRPGRKPEWNHKPQITFRKNYLLTVQSCKLIVGSTEHRPSEGALLHSTRNSRASPSRSPWSNLPPCCSQV